jgi:hypothetical protein
METRDYMEFREVENEAGTDAKILVFFMGVLVGTIRGAWTRSGGHVFSEREMYERRAQKAVLRLWDLAGEGN